MCVCVLYDLFVGTVICGFDNVHLSVRICAYAQVCMYMCLYVCTCVHVRLFVYKHVCTSVCTFVCVFTLSKAPTTISLSIGMSSATLKFSSIPEGILQKYKINKDQN